MSGGDSLPRGHQPLTLDWGREVAVGYNSTFHEWPGYASAIPTTTNTQITKLASLDHFSIGSRQTKGRKPAKWFL